MVTRIDLLNAMAADYDYQTSRHRQIFERLTQGVQYVYNNAVEGDVAEFGTHSGFTALTIAKAMKFYSDLYADFLQTHGAGQKTLHLFDSFQGLPVPDNPVDMLSPNVASGRWKKGMFQSLNKHELLVLCSQAYDHDRIRIADGWFSTTLRNIPPGTRFALIHLDCDLYSSTAEVLDCLFGRDHVSDGGCVFFDDWNCNRASPKFGQRRAWRECVEKYNVQFSDGGDYAVLGHSFIVHSS